MHSFLKRYQLATLWWLSKGSIALSLSLSLTLSGEDDLYFEWETKRYDHVVIKSFHVWLNVLEFFKIMIGINKSLWLSIFDLLGRLSDYFQKYKSLFTNVQEILNSLLLTNLLINYFYRKHKSIIIHFKLSLKQFFLQFLFNSRLVFVNHSRLICFK